MLVSAWQALAVGAIATISMDILTAVSLRLRVIAPLPPTLVGRWFASVAHGRPLHIDIAQAAPVRHELAIALIGHYAIGSALAWVYLTSTRALALPSRPLGVALAFGFGTNLLPWLIMFPLMGYGFFGAHGPAGTRLFVSSCASHAFFGLGLWLAVRIALGS